MKAVLALLAAGTAFAAAAAASRGPFDPTADPAFQLARARTIAMREHKNLLLDLGGNWCVWCLVLDRALHEDPALKRALTAGYVLVHVNISPENMHTSFTANYPQASGYPFLIILSPDGSKVIHAQDGSEFQKGKTPQDGYDHGSVARFLARWRS